MGTLPTRRIIQFREEISYLRKLWDSYFHFLQKSFFFSTFEINSRMNEHSPCEIICASSNLSIAKIAPWSSGRGVERENNFRENVFSFRNDKTSFCELSPWCYQRAFNVHRHKFQVFRGDFQCRLWNFYSIIENLIFFLHFFVFPQTYWEVVNKVRTYLFVISCDGIRNALGWWWGSSKPVWSIW